jgi:hypothetical protein
MCARYSDAERPIPLPACRCPSQWSTLDARWAVDARAKSTLGPCGKLIAHQAFAGERDQHVRQMQADKLLLYHAGAHRRGCQRILGSRPALRTPAVATGKRLGIRRHRSDRHPREGGSRRDGGMREPITAPGSRLGSRQPGAATRNRQYPKSRTTHGRLAEARTLEYEDRPPQDATTTDNVDRSN